MAASTYRPDQLGEALVTTRQAILVAILLLLIATAFAAVAVEVFGGPD